MFVWAVAITALLFVPVAVSGELSQSPLPHPVDSWDFDKHPDPNSTDNLIFSSASSLLETWGNTRYRNGHTIIPGTIPSGTLLYHGSHTSQPPPAGYPEWLAVDPEHSYIFCTSLRSPPNASHPAPNADPCWHLTFVTTRPITVLYFDGAGAGKMPGGSMDSQDVVLWGEVVDTPERRLDERRRATELCQLWGKVGGRGGVDGFVRMELDFEVLLCDFTDGLELVSSLNLEYSDFPDWPSSEGILPSPSIHRQSSVPPNNSHEPASKGQPFFYWLSGVRGLLAGLRHAHFPGETRIKLHYHQLITFYDTALFPSLKVIRRGQDRWEHRLDGIAKEDVKRLRERLGMVLGMEMDGAGTWEGSGVDWKTALRVVQMRWGDGLEVLKRMLNGAVNIKNGAGGEAWQLTQVAKRAHGYIEGMLKPYILNGTRPDALLPLVAATPTQVDRRDEAEDRHTWAKPIFRLCATTQTQYLTKLRLTPSEALIVSSIRGVENEICRVAAGIWASGVEHGLDSVASSESNVGEDDVRRYRAIRKLVEDSEKNLNELTAWLDWNVWVRCEPACLFDEICYLPTWAFFPPQDEEGEGEPSKHSEPRCWKRIHPL